MAYSFWAYYFCIILIVILLIVSIALQFSANNNLPISATSGVNATDLSNNQYASSLLIGSIVLEFLLIILILLLLALVPNTDEKVIIKNPAEAKFGFGNTILYIFNFIFIVVNIIILGIAISYMTSSSTTTDTVSYSKNVTIGALVINLIIFFILLYMYFGEVWGFNSYVDTLTKKPPVPITPLGTQLFTLTTNPLYPGEIIKSDINVNYTYKEYPDYVTVNGQIVKNTSAPQEVTKNETFEYINPLYVKPPSVVTTPTVVTLTPTTTTTSTTNPTTIPTTTASTRVYT